eukprot:TRINITY_DN1144_c0_g4_i5.p1 TRINITY_DN1144_c0_g4~~TRINITY_DN1144_c0_g4_i5.p1  ORF type:complete len:173 (-),score=6.72 TRINITY_DN1144_c0_g4_i5:430-948(-)
MLKPVNAKALRLLSTVIKKFSLHRVIGIHILHLHFPLPAGKFFAEELFLLHKRSLLLRGFPSKRPSLLRPVSVSLVVSCRIYCAHRSVGGRLKGGSEISSRVRASPSRHEAVERSWNRFLTRYGLSDEVMTERNLCHYCSDKFDHLKAAVRTAAAESEVIDFIACDHYDLVL